MTAHKAVAERMLSDDERELLAECSSSLAELPIVQHGEKWGWEFRSIRNTRDYDNEAEAREMFARYLKVLADAKRADQEQHYAAGTPAND